MKRISVFLLLILILFVSFKADIYTAVASKTISEISIDVSHTFYPNGSSSVVILFNDDESEGYWCAPALAGILDCPILIADKNDKLLLNEISRLNPKDVYLIGDTDINFKDFNCTSFNGENTSLDIANFLKEFYPDRFNSIFLVSDNNEALAVADKSAVHNIPILYISKDKIPEPVESFLNYTTYLVGEDYLENVTQLLNKDYVSIKGKEISDISGYSQLFFHSESDSVIIVENSQELIISTVLSRFCGAYVIHYGQDISDYYYSFFENIPIDNYFYFTYENNGRLPLCTKNDYAMDFKSSYALNFDTDKFNGAVFYIPHQDDETLFFSQAIFKAINSFGAENVYVILMSDGAKSGTKDIDDVAKGLDEIMAEINIRLPDELDEQTYTALRTRLFSQSRNNEFCDALHELGIPTKNIQLNQITDGGFADEYDKIEKIIKNYYNNDNSFMHFTTSPYYDSHADHKSLGQALLRVCEYEKNDTFFIVRFDNSIENFTNDIKINNISKKMIYTAPIKNNLKKAIYSYEEYNCESEIIADEISSLIISGVNPIEAVSTAKSVHELKLGIGYCSVGNVFNMELYNLEHNLMLTTVHEPFLMEESSQ